MVIQLAKTRTIGEVRQEFNKTYPFLNIEFYKFPQGKQGAGIKQKLSTLTMLNDAGMRGEGEIQVSGEMTVKQLEQIFTDDFGLYAQVSRKSGSIWLETTISDHWTLKQQNDHGRELSDPVKKNLLPDETDYD